MCVCVCVCVNAGVCGVCEGEVEGDRSVDTIGKMSRVN